MNFGEPGPMLFLVLTAMLCIMHRANIARLMDGTKGKTRSIIGANAQTPATEQIWAYLMKRLCVAPKSLRADPWAYGTESKSSKGSDPEATTMVDARLPMADCGGHFRASRTGKGV
jgi:hypothetical protein